PAAPAAGGILRVHERRRDRDARRHDARQLPDARGRRPALRGTDPGIHAVGAPRPSLTVAIPALVVFSPGIARLRIAGRPLFRPRPPDDEDGERQGKDDLEQDDPHGRFSTSTISGMIRVVAILLALAASGCALCPCAPQGDERVESAVFRETAFDALPGWASAPLGPSLRAFLAGCPRPGALARACELAAAVKPGDQTAARHFFESTFQAYSVASTKSGEPGPGERGGGGGVARRLRRRARREGRRLVP